jgi:hypothetical protein
MQLAPEFKMRSNPALFYFKDREVISPQHGVQSK